MAASFGFAAVADAPRHALRNARAPAVLLDGAHPPAHDGLVGVDIVVADGLIEAVAPRGQSTPDLPGVDLDKGIVFPGFVDVHTHLDKGHIWPRRANPDGTFMGALTSVPLDRAANWSREDVRRRMDFALRCAFAHGTVAIRTHLDSVPPQDEISWPLFVETRQAWRGRIELQAVALAGADHALDPAWLARIAPRAREAGGILGCAMASHPRARDALAALVACATEHGLDLDLHLDETQDAQSTCLRFFAEEILRVGFSGRATAGHCCSLARQAPDEAARTIDLVAQAGIAVVSLPMCNLYLQDRTATPGGPATPRSRGVTLLRELAAAGVATAIASDNTRDPFYAYGDLDGLEVLREGVRIAHLDHPVETAPTLMTKNPAAIMGLAERGRIAAGLPADLLLTRARGWSELFARPQADRTVLRAGRAIDRTLPDHRELDDLMER